MCKIPQVSSEEQTYTARRDGLGDKMILRPEQSLYKWIMDMMKIVWQGNELIPATFDVTLSTARRFPPLSNDHLFVDVINNIRIFQACSPFVGIGYVKWN